MKKTILSSILIVLVSFAAWAQTSKVEVLYFKENLSCCKATSCNALEGDIRTIIGDNFGNDVEFKVVKVAEEANKDLVKKYNAKSQTVVIVKYKKGKIDKSEDISMQVKQFAFDKNKEDFALVLKKEVGELMK